VAFRSIPDVLEAYAGRSVLAGVSGIMVYISIDELLPGAERFGKHHLSILGFIAGMAVMAVSLLIA
jgi:ZIP family zinc transporter